tara:strand:+ start:187 stop:309 length:123 start_codon:yes stop_codon:yes gene_type:complete
MKEKTLMERLKKTTAGPTEFSMRKRPRFNVRLNQKDGHYE